ncbi:MAG: hypothetical protein ABW026_01320 [Microvirga sp.]
MTMRLSRRSAAIAALPAPPCPVGDSIMAPAAVAGVLAALDRGETHYTDRPGILPLRRTIAGILNRRYALACEPGHVTLTCGATEARFVTVQRLLDEGAALAAPAAADAIAGAVLTRGGRMTDDPSQARLLYLTASSSRDDLTAALRAASEDCLVIYEVDDTDATFHPAQVPGLAGRVVTIGEVGIDHGLVGARLGYLAAPPGEAAALRDFKQALTICSTNLSQWAALAVVEDL